MGMLRLLYCDSAGVRRCRAVVHPGELPLVANDTQDVEITFAGAPPQQHHSQSALTARSGSIIHTSSMLDAAAAGVITLKPRSNRAAIAAAASSDIGSEDSDVEFGIRSTPSLTTTPSIAYAAATGFITLPDKHSSSQEKGQPLGCSPLNPAAAKAAAAGSDSPADSPTGNSPSNGGNGSSSSSLARQSSLASTSSLVQAAGAGVIPRKSSLKPQSSLTAGTATAAAGTAISGSLSCDEDSCPTSFALLTTPGLRTTPSMLDAAAAGIITLPRKGSVTFGENKILVAAAEEYGQADAAGAAAADDAAAAATRTAAGGGQKPRPPSPFGTDSLAAAAAAGAAVPGGVPAVPAPAAAAVGSTASSVFASPAAIAAAFAIGLTKATMGQPVYADVQAPDTGLSPVGEVLLVPDLSAAVRLPWCRGHSMAPVDMMERDLRTPWSCCPRSALKTALTALEMPHGFSLMLGFEVEFVLLKPAPAAASPASGSSSSSGAGELLLSTAAGRFVPVDDSIYCQSSALDELAPVLDQMVAALEQMGVGVIQYHAESAPGQFEIATRPYPALEAVDKLLLTKEAISAVARQNGLQVTFLPKPFPGKAGSGLHCHLSLCQASRGRLLNIMTAPGDAATAAVPGYPVLSQSSSLFLAGVLAHLPAMLPLTAPSVNSYARLQPSCWSGSFACWGWDNREAPLRLCYPRQSQPDSCNAEYKAFDGATNPYLGVAAIVAAGLVGLEERAPLPPPVQIDPGAAGASSIGSGARGSRAAAGLPCTSCPALPGSLTEALEALEDDQPFKDKLEQLLGRDLLKAFLAVRRNEASVKPSCDTLLFKY